MSISQPLKIALLALVLIGCSPLHGYRQVNNHDGYLYTEELPLELANFSIDVHFKEAYFEQERSPLFALNMQGQKDGENLIVLVLVREKDSLVFVQTLFLENAKQAVFSTVAENLPLKEKLVINFRECANGRCYISVNGGPEFERMIPHDLRLLKISASNSKLHYRVSPN